MSCARLPKQGIPRERLFAEMRERKRKDADWRGARTWSLCYPAGEDVDDLLAEANQLYLYENALNPFRLPSLREMEVDVVGIALGLLHAPEVADGCMTSGGTESIIMSMKTARAGESRAGHRDRKDRRPLLGPPGLCEGRQLPAHGARPDSTSERLSRRRRGGRAPHRRPDGRRGRIRALLSLRCRRPDSGARGPGQGSGRQLPHGCLSRRLSLAVLGCDWRAGAALRFPSGWRHDDLGRRPQIRLYAQGCLDHQPSRWRAPAALPDVRLRGLARRWLRLIRHGRRASRRPDAAAWAILHWLGEEGYARLASRIRDTTRNLRAGIGAIEGLHVHGDPEMSLFAFGSTRDDIFAIGDVMDDRGWCLDRQTGPDALHLMVSPEHEKVADQFLADLREAVEMHGTSRGKDARYS